MKHYFSLFSCILFVLISFTTLKAQKPIKTDLLPFFENVAAPPATSKEAYEKICLDKDEQGNPICKSEMLNKSLSEKLEMYTKEIAASSLQDNMPTQDQMDMAKQMQDPKMQEKIKNMSQEEKMKWAMELAKGNMPKATTETPYVVKAFKDAGDLNQAYSNDIQKAGTNYQADIENQKILDKKHNEIEEWEKTEISKLPDISTGEMSYKDPKLVKSIRIKAANKHIEVMDEELKKVDNDWASLRTKLKTRCTPFNESLAKCKYGDDAKTKGFVKSFANAQQLIINYIVELITRSQKAYEDSSKFYAVKVNIENEKID
jgi:hypothetical protein